MAAITGQWHPSHSKQLEELSLEPLDTRRTRLCQRWAVRTATRSRHTDIFTPAAGDRTNRSSARGLFREPLCRTVSYYRSIGCSLLDKTTEREIVNVTCDMWTMVLNQLA
jgi:hypothetical protein